MTIGSIVEPSSLPVMSEADALETLRRERHIYNVPAGWSSPDRDEVLVFTADPIEAAYCADVLARQESGMPYRAYVDGGVAVEGPIEVVLVGIPGTEWIDWRPAVEVYLFPPATDEERAHRYALLMCRVRPARELAGAGHRGRA
jgi:hypothetical protein